MEKKVANIDEVLQKFSVVGPFHLKLLSIIFLAYTTNSMYSANYVFATEDVIYRCADEGFENVTCAHANSSYCSKWVYENPHSFVAEFQVGCHAWMSTLVGTIHSAGYMCGLLLVGPLSDRIGRKKAIVLTGVSGGLLGLAKSFSPSYWLYIVLEFLESAIGDICSPVYVLNIEIVSSKKRALYYCLCSFGYIAGGTLLPVVAWAVPYWRNYLRAIYAPALLFFFYIFVLDESPRWLLTQGKKEKAIKVLEKAVKMNNLDISRETLEKIDYEKDKNEISFWNLLKITISSRSLLKRCLVCIVWWTTSTFVNYGITINSVFQEGNKYINFGLVCLVDVPGNLIIMYILMNFKRRNPLICSFLGASILLLIQPFIPSALPWLSTTFYLLGKLLSSFFFSITYMYTSELFPTYTRNSMHALCSSLGRIGSMVAPQTSLLLVYWPGLPSITFGCASLVAGCLTFLVPDIADKSLPDTVKQAEAIDETPKKEIYNTSSGDKHWTYSPENTKHAVTES